MTLVCKKRLTGKTKEYALLLRLQSIKKVFRDLILDSQGSFSQNRPRRHTLRWNLDAAVALAQREYATLSADLKSLDIVYSVHFNDILRNISVENSQRLLPLITAGSRDFEYSGIVIFVSKQLPVHGRFNERKTLEPALAPTIFDENGETLLSLATVDAQIFEQDSGGVEYTYETNMYRWSPFKVGLNPLVISAVAVSGESNTTDIVLSLRDANLLRSSPKALEMLRQAKVLVVLG
jgi:hypothetical protein